MTDARRKRKTTSGFRAYCCREEDIPAQGSARKTYVAFVVDGILNLLTLAQDRVQQTVEFLSTAQTRAHLKSGRPVPKAMRTRVEEAFNKVNSAYACFTSGGVKDVIEDQNATYGMTLARDQAQNLHATLDDDAAFLLTREPDKYVSTLGRLLAELITTLEKTHMIMVPYAQQAAVATVPPVIERSSPVGVKAKRHALTPNSELAPFLEQLRAQGWKTPEPKPTYAPLFGMDDGEPEADGFDQAADLIRAIQRPKTELLPHDEEIGIIKFPVISLNRKRIPESLIRYCTDPRIGYSVYIVFGGYMVVDNMCLLGIHKSLMWIAGADGAEINVAKFTHLLPYVKREYPQWREPLTLLHPVQPTRMVGDHCYCPLLPVSILRSWGNGIGAWELLNS